MDGIFIIDKPKGITSRDVVNNISKKFNIKKVGHTGTLDPIATGVLVVCVDSATKIVSELTSLNKEYIASVTLGLLTDTLDITGNIIKDVDVYKTKEEIEVALKRFKVSYNQEVPIYSAVKINGKKLYEYAREGKMIDLPKRMITINSIELIGDVIYENNKTKFTFKCNVSKGTYIRALINDIAKKLNTVGIMTDLRRTAQGKFDIKNSKTLEEVNKDDLINIIDVLDYKKIEIDSILKKKIKNGAIIDNKYGCDTILFTYSGEGIAIYKKYLKDETKLKPYKMLKGGIL